MEVYVSLYSTSSFSHQYRRQSIVHVSCQGKGSSQTVVHIHNLLTSSTWASTDSDKSRRNAKYRMTMEGGTVLKGDADHELLLIFLFPSSSAFPCFVFF